MRPGPSRSTVALARPTAAEVQRFHGFRPVTCQQFTHGLRSYRRVERRGPAARSPATSLESAAHQRFGRLHRFRLGRRTRERACSRNLQTFPGPIVGAERITRAVRSGYFGTSRIAVPSVDYHGRFDRSPAGMTPLDPSVSDAHSAAPGTTRAGLQIPGVRLPSSAPFTCSPAPLLFAGSGRAAHALHS